MPHVGKTRTHPTFLPYRARDPFREARIHTSTICPTVPSVPPPQTWAKDDEEAGVAQTPPTPRAEGRLRLLWGGREEAKNASGARTDAGRLQGSYLSRTNNPRMEKPKTVPSTYRQLVLLLLDGSNTKCFSATAICSLSLRAGIPFEHNYRRKSILLSVVLAPTKSMNFKVYN